MVVRSMWVVHMMMVHMMMGVRRRTRRSTPRVAWNEVNDAYWCVVVSIPTDNRLSTGSPLFVVRDVTDDLVPLVPHKHVHFEHLADNGQFDGTTPRTVVAHVLYIRMRVLFACILEPLTQGQAVGERLVHVHGHVVAYITTQSHPGRFNQPW